MEFMGIYFGSRYYDDLEVIEDNMSNFSEKYDEWYNDYSILIFASGPFSGPLHCHKCFCYQVHFFFLFFLGSMNI